MMSKLRNGVVSARNKALELKRAAALSLTSEEALPELSQLTGSAEAGELLISFPCPDLAPEVRPE